MSDFFLNSLQTIPWAIGKIYEYVEDYLPWGWFYYIPATDYMMNSIQTKLHGATKPYFYHSSLAYYDHLSFGLGSLLFILVILIVGLGSWIYEAFEIQEFVDSSISSYNSYTSSEIDKSTKNTNYTFLKVDSLLLEISFLCLHIQAYLIALAYLLRYCYIWILYTLVYLFLIFLYFGQIIYPTFIVIWSWSDLYEFYDILYVLVAYLLTSFSNQSCLKAKDSSELLSFIDTMGNNGLWSSLSQENNSCKALQKINGADTNSKLSVWSISAFFFMTAGFIFTYSTGFFLAPYYLSLFWTLCQDLEKVYLELSKESDPLNVLYWFVYGWACLLLLLSLSTLLVHLFSFTFPLYGSSAHWYWIVDCYHFGLSFWLSWLPYIVLKYCFNFFNPQESSENSLWDLWN